VILKAVMPAITEGCLVHGFKFLRTLVKPYLQIDSVRPVVSSIIAKFGLKNIAHLLGYATVCAANHC